jgi:hypothetical protein
VDAPTEQMFCVSCLLQRGCPDGAVIVNRFSEVIKRLIVEVALSTIKSGI